MVAITSPHTVEDGIVVYTASPADPSENANVRLTVSGDPDIGFMAYVATPNDTPLLAAIVSGLREFRPLEMEPALSLQIYFDAAANLVTSARVNYHGAANVGLKSVTDVLFRHALRNNYNPTWINVKGEEPCEIVMLGDGMKGINMSVVPADEPGKFVWGLHRHNEPITWGPIDTGMDLLIAAGAMDREAYDRGLLFVRMQVGYEKCVRAAQMMRNEIDSNVPLIPINLPGQPGVRSLASLSRS